MHNLKKPSAETAFHLYSPFNNTRFIMRLNLLLRAAILTVVSSKLVAATDWPSPCIDGTCSFEIPASQNSMAGLLEIVSRHHRHASSKYFLLLTNSLLSDWPSTLGIRHIRGRWLDCTRLRSRCLGSGCPDRLRNG